MTIDLKTIKHISKLSRISVNEQKAEKLADDLNSIFKFIEKLNELKTDNVEPLTSVAKTTLKLRVDEVKSKDIPHLRRKIGIIFQDFQLLKDRTVFNNLDFVLKATGWNKVNSRREKIELCLSKVHIIELINKFPSQLSGGEKQKVAIARALLNDPEIIIADEPTGNLDPKSSLEIMEVLSEINSNGNTILMATHDFSLLKKYKGRILRCKDGLVDEIDSDNLEIEKIYS